jgi:FtsZ-interacting cell division protein ZipA
MLLLEQHQSGAAAKNAGKRLLELQSHDLCDWFTELRDMILVPVVILIIISLVVVLVCVLRSRRRKSDGSMATMSTNYKSQVQDSFSISSSHHGSSDFTQATNVPKFNIHLPASLQPATFSPPPPLPQQPIASTTAATPSKDKHETQGEKITRRHTSVGQEKKKSQAKRSASQYQQRRRASYQHQQRRQQRHESTKKKHYSSTESDSESSYSEDGL